MGLRHVCTNVLCCCLQFVRPENVTSEQAVAALLDARSILRDMQDVVASPLDSQERFYARKMWPAYAKWLREVGPSAPVVSGIIGGTDKEATLSEEYGGMAGQAAGVSWGGVWEGQS